MSKIRRIRVSGAGWKYIPVCWKMTLRQLMVFTLVFVWHCTSGKYSTVPGLLWVWAFDLCSKLQVYQKSVCLFVFTSGKCCISSNCDVVMFSSESHTGLWQLCSLLSMRCVLVAARHICKRRRKAHSLLDSRRRRRKRMKNHSSPGGVGKRYDIIQYSIIQCWHVLYGIIQCWHVFSRIKKKIQVSAAGLVQSNYCVCA